MKERRAGCRPRARGARPRDRNAQTHSREQQQGPVRGEGYGAGGRGVSRMVGSSPRDRREPRSDTRPPNRKHRDRQRTHNNRQRHRGPARGNRPATRHTQWRQEATPKWARYRCVTSRERPPPDGRASRRRNPPQRRPGVRRACPVRAGRPPRPAGGLWRDAVRLRACSGLR